MNEFDEIIAKLESELALSPGFFEGLQTEDDWSFIVKCHALMETACSVLLTAYFKNPNYEDIFSRIEMSDTKKGKVAFLKAAGLVVPEEAKFIVALSELRNRLVHSIRGIAFKFSDYVSALDKNQKKSFAKSFGYAYLDSDSEEKLVLKDSTPILSDPKAAIFHGIRLILGIIMLQVETRRFQDEAKEHQRRIYELMTANRALHPIAQKTGSG